MRRRAPPSPALGPNAPAGPAQYLEENDLLIEAIRQNQNLGRLHECLQYQLQLQQNLVHLAMHADEQPGIQPLSIARAADAAASSNSAPSLAAPPEAAA